MLSTIHACFYSNGKTAHHQVVTITQAVFTAGTLLPLASMYAAKPRFLPSWLRAKRIETLQLRFVDIFHFWKKSCFPPFSSP